MPGSTPGPQKGDNQGSIKDQTSALIATPKPSPTGIKYVKGKGISWELKDAPPMCVPTTLSTISEEEMQVLAWLRKFKTEIISAEAQFQVDRRAIATAIAWEALVNVGTGSLRAVGPGKPHVFATMWSAIKRSSDDNTWTEAVEDARLLPKQSLKNRIAILKTPEGAIQYIAAIMDLVGIIYEQNGSPGVMRPPLRRNPPILTQIYWASDFKKWSARVKTIKPGERLHIATTVDGILPQSIRDGLGIDAPDSMPYWYLTPHNQQLVEDGVGLPQLLNSGPGACATSSYRDVMPQEATLILERAKTYKDTPYEWDGNSKNGIDCSHLVSRAINEALPSAQFTHVATATMAASPSVRTLAPDEDRVSGDLVLFAHHVGFLDTNPPTPGRTLFSAEGDQNKSEPGVTWGKIEWFGPATYLRVRVPTK